MSCNRGACQPSCLSVRTSILASGMAAEGEEDRCGGVGTKYFEKTLEDVGNKIWGLGRTAGSQIKEPPSLTSAVLYPGGG